MKLHNIVVCHVNVRSLLAQTRLLDLEILVNLHDIDVLCLSETWLSADRAPTSCSINLPGFQLAARRDRPDRHGGGVAIYVRQQISFTSLSVSTAIECVGIQLLLSKSQKLNILSVYRPPGSSMEIFLEELESFLSSTRCLVHPLCIAGDLNCKSQLWWDGQTNSKDSKLLEDFSYEHGLSQIVKGPTRCVDGGSPSQLDLVFLSEPQRLISASVLPPLSDHCPTLACLSVKPQTRRSAVAYSWDYFNADWEALREALRAADWSSVLCCTDVDAALQKWSDLFLSNVYAFVPRKRIHSGVKKPWFSPFLHRLARCRNRLFKRSRGLVESHPILVSYRRVRNWYVKELRFAQRAYYRRASDSLSSTELSRRPHHWWNQVKLLCGMKGRDQLPTLVDTDTGHVCTTSVRKAEVLNSHFARQCSAQAREAEYFPALLPTSKPQFEFQQINPSEVVRHLASLNTWKASGMDKISNLLLKECRTCLGKPLCYIFNLSLKERRFPCEWKKAVIQPLLKQKGDRSLPGSYRPIALLSNVSKVFESLIHAQLLKHCLENSCLPEEQFGFLPKRSTVWQLLTILEDWHKALDRGDTVHALFVDVAKAFDRVDHGLLLLKLASIEIGSEPLRLFESYLRGRCICTTVDNSCSSLQPISSGVPQGSVLGPLLFVIYFRDLPSYLNSLSCLFADDTLLYAFAPNVDSCKSLQKDSEQLDAWAETWNTTFNAEKSAHLVFCSNVGNVPGYTVQLQGIPVPSVTATRHLGVHLSSTLSWSKHISTLRSRVAPLVGLIKRLAFRSALRSSVFFLSRLYLSFVRPRLEYASVVWGNSCLKKECKDLERLQTSAARAICRSCLGLDLRSSAALQHLNWPTLAWRRRTSCLFYLWRLLHQEGPPQLQQALPRPASERCQYSLRNASTSFQFPFCRTTRYLNSFLPDTLIVWNTLPSTIVNSKSFSVFSSRLIDHFSGDKFSFGLSS